MSSIDVVCACDEHTKEYFKLLKKSCDLLKSNNHKLNYICVGINSELNDLKEFDDIQVIQYNVTKKLYPSLYHTNALHKAFSSIKSEYVIFIDADVILLKKNWDQDIIQLLETYFCTGFQYRFSNFPGVILFACKKNLIHKLDFSPHVIGMNRQEYQIKNIKESQKFGKSVGSKMLCDSGWKHPLTFLDTKQPAKTMHEVYTYSNNAKLPFENATQQLSLQQSKSLSMIEYHLDDEVFGTHLKVSRNRKLSGDHVVDTWLNRISLYFHKLGIPWD